MNSKMQPLEESSNEEQNLEMQLVAISCQLEGSAGPNIFPSHGKRFYFKILIYRLTENYKLKFIKINCRC